MSSKLMSHFKEVPINSYLPERLLEMCVDTCQIFSIYRNKQIIFLLIYNNLVGNVNELPNI